jgi:mycothiol synthase
MAEVENESVAADQIEETTQAEDIANDFEHAENFDPARDVVLVEAEGGVVGYAKLTWSINDEGQRIYWQAGQVRPEWRRKGLGKALLGYTEARTQQLAQAHPFDGPNCLRGMGEDTALGKIALFESAGYSILRYFFFMKRDSLEDLPSVTLPEGFEFRPATEEDDRTIWLAKEEAFRDHWGHTNRTEVDYQHWLHSPYHQPDLWPVIWDVARNEVAAMSLNCIVADENATFGFLRGSINALGVRRPYRGKGLGRAVLLKSLEMVRERGMTEAVLGVDSENPSGALGLYERSGFTVINKDALYQKPLVV